MVPGLDEGFGRDWRSDQVLFEFLVLVTLLPLTCPCRAWSRVLPWCCRMMSEPRGRGKQRTDAIECGEATLGSMRHPYQRSSLRKQQHNNTTPDSLITPANRIRRAIPATSDFNLEETMFIHHPLPIFRHIIPSSSPIDHSNRRLPSSLSLLELLFPHKT